MSETAPQLDLRPDHWAIVRGILREYVPSRKILAFGSRATWTAKEYSDLDLAIMGNEPLSLDTTTALAECFVKSDLPFKVDLVDWARIDETFRSIIYRDAVAVQVPTECSEPAGSVRPGIGRRHAVSLKIGVQARSKWRRVALDDVIDLRLSSVDKQSREEESPVRLCNYMDVYNNSFIHGRMDFITATATEREIANCALSAGDVVITKDSEKHDDIGVPALVREDIPDLVCGYHLAILHPQLQRVDGTYLFYALCTDEAKLQFHGYANGITRFWLRKTDIGLVEIPLPPLAEQRAIAHILGTLDDKNELNRRLKETMETMARAIFKDWFVDFGPVRAKMEGRDTGLSGHIAELFPDRLADSELGEIPEGWESGRLDDIVSLNPENWKSSRHPQTISYVDLTSAKWGYIENVQTCPWERAPSSARRVLHKRDTIVATVRPENGSFALIEENGLTASTGFAVLRPRQVYDRDFVWCAATSADNINRLAHLADGGVGPAIQPDAVSETPIALANREVRVAFAAHVGPMLDRVEAYKRQSSTLVALRDSLLVKLISGEVRAQDAEPFISKISSKATKVLEERASS